MTKAGALSTLFNLPGLGSSRWEQPHLRCTHLLHNLVPPLQSKVPGVAAGAFYSGMVPWQSTLILGEEQLKGACSLPHAHSTQHAEPRHRRRTRRREAVL